MNRIAFLDLIRGVMIVWMLIVHISLNYGYIKFGAPVTTVSIFTLMSFFMTPFYVFSGYLFSPKRDFFEFTRNKFTKLIIPYLFFTIFGVIVYEIYEYVVLSSVDFGYLKSFIHTAAFKSNTPCWFFISLFFVSEIYYLLQKYLGGAFLRIAIALIFVLAFLSCNRPQYFGHGNILLGLVYYHLGQELKSHEKIIMKFWKYVFVNAFVVYVIIGFFFPTSLSFVLNILRGGNYISNFLFSVSACLLLYLLFSKLPQKNSAVEKIIIYIGETSLVIFAFHRPVLNWILEPLIKHVNSGITYLPFLFICLFSILLLSYIFNIFMNRFLPVFLGKTIK